MTETDKENKRGRDTTQTPRQKAYLERLGDGNGKRLVVDLDAEGRRALETLLADDYGKTNKEVVIRALVAAAKKPRKKA
ncbi:MAG: hypothetical protein FD131_3247 [Rhodocyclaceae bacterium]|nr:MAG: hypothetical protein FD131_3247 [Rhodocyclaceae bacterium]